MEAEPEVPVDGGMLPRRFVTTTLRRRGSVCACINTRAEAIFVASNYADILARIAKPALDGASLELNRKVVSVNTPGTREPGSMITATTADGSSYAFDELVMATPLGLLKEHRDAFTPPLPPRLSAAIENIGLSHLEKVFITFPSAFWISGLSADSFSCCANWLAPAYAPDTNPHRWPQEAWNLASFGRPNSRPTLLFYTFGDCSRHIVQAVHGKTREEKHRFLTGFFRPYYSRLPGFDPESPACIPQAVLATEWQRDELSGNASYCNFQVGIEDADQDVLALREGCMERRLWFCGEHAAPFEECGTVTGALLSGQAVAEKIVEANQAMKMDICSHS